MSSYIEKWLGWFNRFSILTQSSKEQYIDECDGKNIDNGKNIDKADSDASFIFYYTINTGSESKLYSIYVFPA